MSWSFFILQIPTTSSLSPETILCCGKTPKHNPLAIDHTTYQQQAKDAGYDDVMEYMRSGKNPKIGDTQRVSGLEHKCDGATCIVLCATDLVSKYAKNTPIEVLGIGKSAPEQ